MKRIITTSASFIGEVHIVYSDRSQLLEVDFRHAELTARQVEYILRFVPVHFDERLFADAFGTARLEFVIEGYEVSFADFWKKYDQKINAIRCEKIWNKLSNADRHKAYFGLAAYFRHLQKNSWKNKADPESYLKNKYWENEWK